MAQQNHYACSSVVVKFWGHDPGYGYVPVYGMTQDVSALATALNAGHWHSPEEYPTISDALRHLQLYLQAMNLFPENQVLSMLDIESQIVLGSLDAPWSFPANTIVDGSYIMSICEALEAVSRLSMDIYGAALDYALGVVTIPVDASACIHAKVFSTKPIHTTTEVLWLCCTVIPGPLNSTYKWSILIPSLEPNSLPDYSFYYPTPTSSFTNTTTIEQPIEASSPLERSIPLQQIATSRTTTPRSPSRPSPLSPMSGALVLYARPHLDTMTPIQILEAPGEILGDRAKDVTGEVILRVAREYSNTEIFTALNHALRSAGKQELSSLNVVTRRITVAIASLARRSRRTTSEVRAEIDAARKRNGVKDRMYRHVRDKHARRKSANPTAENAVARFRRGATRHTHTGTDLQQRALPSFDYGPPADGYGETSVASVNRSLLYVAPSQIHLGGESSHGQSCTPDEIAAWGENVLSPALNDWFANRHS